MTTFTLNLCGSITTAEPFCSLDPDVPVAEVGEGSVPNQQPNIIVIQFDDLGFADFQFNDYGLARTPNLNRLMRDGLTSERYFTAVRLEIRPKRLSLFRNISMAWL